MADERIIPTDAYFESKMRELGLFYQDSLTDPLVQSTVLEKVSADVAARYKVIPIFLEKEHVVMVTSNPQSIKEEAQIAKDIGCSIKLLFCKNEELQKALLVYYDIHDAEMARTSKKRRVNANSNDGNSPLKQTIQEMLQEAARKKAADIHLLPTADGMLVHFDINGHLIDYGKEFSFAEEDCRSIINIIKNMDESGQANSANINMPGQGSFMVAHGDVNIDVRLSSIPVGGSTDGLQKIVLRLLPRVSSRVSLDALGYAENELFDIRKMLLKASTGITIMSGPTGSGKTTSLYGQIYEDNNILGEYQNVFTIEDPIEIHEPTFCQVQVRKAPDEKNTLSASLILETAMRQAPKIILYGEIRTPKDVSVAVNAAQTGHKVFATVHAKDVMTTIARLLDLGAEKPSLLREINMIMNQRLVGILCEHCRKEHTLTDLEKSVLSKDELKLIARKTLYERGDADTVKKCPHCDGGYEKRIAVLEYIFFDMELRDQLLDPNIRFSTIKALLDNRKFKTTWEKGFELFTEGKTDLKELFFKIGKPE